MLTASSMGSIVTSYSDTGSQNDKVKKMNKIEITTIETAVKHGFTFRNDSHFKNFNQGDRTIRSLIKKEFLIKIDEGNGVEYRATQQAKDFLKYGI